MTCPFTVATVGELSATGPKVSTHDGLGNVAVVCAPARMPAVVAAESVEQSTTAMATVHNAVRDRIWNRRWRDELRPDLAMSPSMTACEPSWDALWHRVRLSCTYDLGSREGGSRGVRDETPDRLRDAPLRRGRRRRL